MLQLDAVLDAVGDFYSESFEWFAKGGKKGGGKRGGKKNCKKQQCGASCISLDKVCRKGVSAAGQTTGPKTKAKAKKTTGGVGATEDQGQQSQYTTLSTDTPEGKKAITAGFKAWKKEYDSFYLKGWDVAQQYKASPNKSIGEDIIKARVSGIRKKIVLVDGSKEIQSAAVIKIRANDIYVELLATAPWNIPGNKSSKSTSGAGTQAMREIVMQSASIGRGGRIELQPLPGAVSFYKKLGFIDPADPGGISPYPEKMILSTAAAKKLLETTGGIPSNLKFAAPQADQQYLDELAALEDQAYGAFVGKRLDRDALTT